MPSLSSLGFMPSSWFIKLLALIRPSWRRCSSSVKCFSYGVFSGFEEYCLVVAEVDFLELGVEPEPEVVCVLSEEVANVVSVLIVSLLLVLPALTFLLFNQRLVVLNSLFWLTPFTNGKFVAATLPLLFNVVLVFPTSMEAFDVAAISSKASAFVSSACFVAACQAST